MLALYFIVRFQAITYTWTHMYANTHTQNTLQKLASETWKVTRISIQPHSPSLKGGEWGLCEPLKAKGLEQGCKQRANIYLLRASQVVWVVKNLPVNAGDIKDAGLIPRLERSPRRGNGNPLQYSCLENPVDRGVWWVSVHRVAKGQTWLKRLSTIDLRFVIRKMMLVLLTIPTLFFPACKALSIPFSLPLTT